MTPLVSIIVPVYNEAAHLSETVDSVLAQTVEHWELLLVDDGSTDGSDAICERLAAQDKRIRVLHTEHRGVSAARNAALAATRGKWVQFLDADDLLDARCLETLLRNSSGFERVCCGFRWYPDGRACVPCVRETALNSPAEIETADTYFPLLSVVWSGLFRRAALACRFGEAISIGEDILFNADWFNTPRAVRLLPDVLYCYRVSPPPPPRIGDLQALETVFRRIQEVYGNAPQLRTGRMAALLCDGLRHPRFQLLHRAARGHRTKLLADYHWVFRSPGVLFRGRSDRRSGLLAGVRAQR